MANLSGALCGERKKGSKMNVTKTNLWVLGARERPLARPNDDLKVKVRVKPATPYSFQ